MDKCSDQKALHTKLVLRKKRKERGKIVKCKARIVVCGNAEDEFFDDSFALVGDLRVAKLVMCMCIQRGWEVKQLDFDNAFPNGKLKRIVYVELSLICPNAVVKKMGY